jgi:hypothetical protein
MAALRRREEHFGGLELGEPLLDQRCQVDTERRLGLDAKRRALATLAEKV